MFKVLEERNLTPPAYVTELLTRLGGVNRYGQPQYRIVWGWSRFDVKAGEWHDWMEGDKPAGSPIHGIAPATPIRRVVEYRKEPRYPLRGYFYLEYWRPPESYGSPLLWRQFENVIGPQNVQSMGEFPSRGDYEYLWRFQVTEESEDKTKKNLAPLWPNATYVERALQLHRKSMQRRRADLYKARVESEDYEKKERKRLYRDIIKDRSKAFH